MTSVAINQTRWATEQRLSLSVLASILLHALAIIMLASLLSELSASSPPRGPASAAIEVAIVAARPIPFSAPPEEPVLATELPAPMESPAREPAPDPPPPAPANALVAQPEPDAFSAADAPTLEPSSDGISTT